MTTYIYKNDYCLMHASEGDHPEHALRIERILEELRKPEYSKLVFVDSEKADEEMLALAHSKSYLMQLGNMLPHLKEVTYLDPSTLGNKHTLNAALYSVGMVRQAVDDVISMKANNAFCLTRPPGHHAKRSRLGGFCVVNNIAIAALYALQREGVNKVAIIDFDVHHGNGTQDIFWSDERVLFASTHQRNIFPMEGYENEIGDYNNILNIPLNAGAGEEEIIDALEDFILPRVRDHQPDMLFISAGFDSHRLDLLAGLNMDTESYNSLGVMFKKLAKELCGGRMVCTLEGGYNRDVLGASVGQFIKGIN